MYYFEVFFEIFTKLKMITKKGSFYVRDPMVAYHHTKFQKNPSVVLSIPKLQLSGQKNLGRGQHCH